eukprot:gnl/MRDRNA2_/MRDRNA2_93769_c0_seq1.p1 gnl/MRDRNA2_/MRDRNA2_93769_c0~~gnl/MRDRNA2_/MRDRNA2_93769_c0_seq1.p1  ORF type:complete len:282 (-),score=47.56 gnl/MRDRNA2_/MRDRNA2_93769_c0_seq1:51-896(-)
MRKKTRLWSKSRVQSSWDFWNLCSKAAHGAGNDRDENGNPVQRRQPSKDPLERPGIKRLLLEIDELDTAIAEVRELQLEKAATQCRLIRGEKMEETEACEGDVSDLLDEAGAGLPGYVSDDSINKVEQQKFSNFLRRKTGIKGSWILGSQPSPRSYFRKEIESTCIHVDPRKVLFTNPCINDRFSCGRSLESTIAALSSGELSPEDMPFITVVQQGDKVLTLDHRRLYAFRAALPAGTKVPARLLTSNWIPGRYISPNCKTYHAVKVEKDELSHGREGVSK